MKFYDDVESRLSWAEYKISQIKEALGDIPSEDELAEPAKAYLTDDEHSYETFIDSAYSCHHYMNVYIRNFENGRLDVAERAIKAVKSALSGSVSYGELTSVSVDHGISPRNWVDFSELGEQMFDGVFETIVHEGVVTRDIAERAINEALDSIQRCVEEVNPIMDQKFLEFLVCPGEYFIQEHSGHLDLSNLGGK